MQLLQILEDVFKKKKTLIFWGNLVMNSQFQNIQTHD